MGYDRSENTKWAEDIYWAHFQHIHFSQFLLSDFHNQLAIPSKFSNNLRKKLPDSVTLKGPGGGMWSVGVTTIDDSLFFKQNWEEFVNDHRLAENDFLIFKYNGDSLFEVLIFDGKSLCEKEYSYFVKRPEREKQEPEEMGSSKRKLKEIACDEINNASSENVGYVSPEKSRDDLIVIVTPTPERNTRKKLDHKRGRGCDASSSRRSLPRDRQIVSNSTAMRLRRTGYGLFYGSNRRPVTDDERATALLLAQESLTESNSHGFLVIMKPSHVYKRFYVLLPSDWVSKFISLENQDLFLRVGEKEWRTRFNYNQMRGSAAITSGWKHFSIDNNLEQFDVVMFEPGGPVLNSLCLDVKIFRVVPEIALLTQLANSPKSRRKKKNNIERDEEKEEVEEEEEEEGDEEEDQEQAIV